MRFYGQSPMFWSEQAPMPMVRAHLRMLPVLSAEESLSTLDVYTVGAGRVKRHAAQAYRRSLMRRAERGRAPRARREPQPADVNVLASVGIKTVM